MPKFVKIEKAEEAISAQKTRTKKLIDSTERTIKQLTSILGELDTASRAMKLGDAKGGLMTTEESKRKIRNMIRKLKKSISD